MVDTLNPPARDMAQTVTQTDSERRQAERKLFSTRMRLGLPGRPEIEVRSIDIGTGGMGMVSELNLAPGTPCNLAFSLPQPDGSWHKAQVAGTVAYSTYSSKRNGFVNGVRFMGMSAALLAAVEAYLRG